MARVAMRSVDAWSIDAMDRGGIVTALPCGNDVLDECTAAAMARRKRGAGVHWIGAT